ncbi:hypothetical protein [Anaerosoma tenue]|uniref:hypothetical protein n=1 Tax=Anaerosoma tenue TaxID=2933588 RepID=UPI0022608928|nr:hypothetical protein [Anaerosoma tenue]MCK8115385.1 hypothetical protein [Anaerosoma tenue]
MKARYSYLLLFLVPSAMIAFLVMAFTVGAGAGALWIFVYGDSPWPESSRTLLAVFGAVVFIATLAMLLVASFRYGKRREGFKGLSKGHAITAVGISVLIPLLILLRLWSGWHLG